MHKKGRKEREGGERKGRKGKKGGKEGGREGGRVDEVVEEEAKLSRSKVPYPIHVSCNFFLWSI